MTSYIIISLLLHDLCKCVDKKNQNEFSSNDIIFTMEDFINELLTVAVDGLNLTCAY